MPSGKKSRIHIEIQHEKLGKYISGKVNFLDFFFFFLKPQIKNFYMDDWLSTVALAAQNILI